MRFCFCCIWTMEDTCCPGAWGVRELPTMGTEGTAEACGGAGDGRPLTAGGRCFWMFTWFSVLWPGNICYWIGFWWGWYRVDISALSVQHTLINEASDGVYHVYIYLYCTYLPSGQGLGPVLWLCPCMAGVGQGLDWGPAIGAICIPFGHKTIQIQTSPLQKAPAALNQNSSVHVNTRSEDIVSCVSRPETVRR